MPPSPTSRKFPNKLRSNRGSNMIGYRNILWSTIFFLVGFYIRGIVDFYSVIDRQQQQQDIQQTKDKNQFSSLEKMLPDERTDDRTHWCVIANKFLPRTTRGHFDHFPHASEIILPCWSYFVKNEVTKRCGFALASKNFFLPAWIKELVDAMGCQIKQSDQGLPKSNIADFVPSDDIQYIPNYYLLRPRLDYFRYLDHPEHAHMLRRLFVNDECIATMKGNDKPWQIGIIQRQGARRFDNLNEIFETLVQDIPEANITITDFKFKTVKEQATWFATKDVIIASHGAALTNSIFITPGTIVLQMYPPGYFLQTLEVRLYSNGFCYNLFPFLNLMVMFFT